jgi:hypothetical protein
MKRAMQTAQSAGNSLRGAGGKTHFALQMLPTHFISSKSKKSEREKHGH